MGSLCSSLHQSPQLIVVGEYEMPGLEADEAESVFRDIESSPEFVPHITKIEFLRGEPSTVGACWKETRIWNGSETTIRKSITEMSKDPYFTVCATATTEDEAASNRSCWTANFLQTFTFSIEPRVAQVDTKIRSNDVKEAKEDIEDSLETSQEASVDNSNCIDLLRLFLLFRLFRCHIPPQSVKKNLDRLE